MKKLLKISTILLFFSCSEDEDGLFSFLTTPCDEPKIEWKIIDEYKEVFDEQVSEYTYYVKIQYKTKAPSCYTYPKGSKLGLTTEKIEIDRTIQSISNPKDWKDGEWIEKEIFLGNCHTEDYVRNNTLYSGRDEQEIELWMATYEAGGGLKIFGKSKKVKWCY